MEFLELKRKMQLKTIKGLQDLQQMELLGAIHGEDCKKQLLGQELQVLQ